MPRPSRQVAAKPAAKPSGAVAKVIRQPLKAVYVGGILTPKDPRQIAFCEAWLGEARHDHKKAALLAGYSEAHIKNLGARQLLKKFERYLQKQKEIRERAVAKAIALEQQDILKEMMAIAFCNPQDYVLVVEEPETDKETGVVTTHKRERQKPIMQLTRLQAAAISEVTFNGDGTVTYKLPGVNAKHPYIKDLAQHIGMLHPKLIQEHRHEHLHRRASYAHVPDAELAALEQQYLRTIGPEGRRQLGIIDVEEYEDVSPG